MIHAPPFDILLLLTMAKQAQVRGNCQHTDGTSARLVRRGITLTLTTREQIYLAVTTDTVARERAVSNTPPAVSIHIPLESPHSSNVIDTKTMNSLGTPLHHLKGGNQ